MATFVLIHGGGGSAWDWHRVRPLLDTQGHRTVAVDLPITDVTADLHSYTDVVSQAVAAGPTTSPIIVVGHSLGGYTAPLVAERLAADRLVFLSGMIPRSGEKFMDWWHATGHDQLTLPDGEAAQFFNDVPTELITEAERHARDQDGAWLDQPWPADRLPDVATSAILCLDDQFFPPDFMRNQISDRLGVTPDEIPGGHYVAISRPDAVADQLLRYAESI